MASERARQNASSSVRKTLRDEDEAQRQRQDGYPPIGPEGPCFNEQEHQTDHRSSASKCPAWLCCGPARSVSRAAGWHHGTIIAGTPSPLAQCPSVEPRTGRTECGESKLSRRLLEAKADQGQGSLVAARADDAGQQDAHQALAHDHAGGKQDAVPPGRQPRRMPSRLPRRAGEGLPSPAEAIEIGA